MNSNTTEKPLRERLEKMVLDKPQENISTPIGLMNYIVGLMLDARNQQPIASESVTDDNDEAISHLACLPISEIYLHGVIAGQRKRIKQLEAQQHTSNTDLDKVREIIENRKLQLEASTKKTPDEITDFIITELTDLLTQIDKLNK